jgi:hypothetical protein
VTDTNVFRLSQPETFTDALTEVLRLNGREPKHAAVTPLSAPRARRGGRVPCRAPRPSARGVDGMLCGAAGRSNHATAQLSCKGLICTPRNGSRRRRPCRIGRRPCRIGCMACRRAPLRAQDWKEILDKFDSVYAREPAIVVRRAVAPDDNTSSLIETALALFWPLVGAAIVIHAVGLLRMPLSLIFAAWGRATEIGAVQRQFSQLANSKTATEVPKPSPKRQASAEPQSPPEIPTPPLLSGAAPTLPTGSFENHVGSRR